MRKNEEEEKREKDEIEAQKQREVRCSVCSIRGRGAVLGDRSRSFPSEKAAGGLFFIFGPFRGVCSAIGECLRGSGIKLVQLDWVEQFVLQQHLLLEFILMGQHVVLLLMRSLKMIT